LAWGSTFITSDPGEQVLVITSRAYDSWGNHEGALLHFIGGADIFSFDTTANAIFSTNGLDQLFAQNTFSSLLKASGVVRISFDNTTSFFMEMEKDNTSADENIRVRNTAQIQFSTIRRTGTGYWEAGGISLTPFYQFYYADSPDTPGTPEHTAGAALSIRLPWLFPFQNPQRFTVNLPLEFGATLYLSSGIFARLSGSAVLFSFEIQKGIPGVPLFVRRVSVIPGYTCSFLKDGTYSDILTLRAAAVLGINTGVLANVGFELDFNVTWRNIGQKQSEGPKFTFSYSLRY
jgi:hypothetical protein